MMVNNMMAMIREATKVRLKTKKAKDLINPMLKVNMKHSI
jgi:hypothetical protein